VLWYSGNSLPVELAKQENMTTINKQAVDIDPLYLGKFTYQTLDLDTSVYDIDFYKKMNPDEKRKDKMHWKMIKLNTKLPLPKLGPFELKLDVDKVLYESMSNLSVTAACNTVYCSGSPSDEYQQYYKGSVTWVKSSKDGQFIAAGFQDGRVIIFEYAAIFEDQLECEDEEPDYEQQFESFAKGMIIEILK